MKMHDIFCALFSEVRITRSLVLCACFVDPYLPFFLLAIMLSVLLRLTDSDFPFGISKLFLNVLIAICWKTLNF